MQLSFQLEEGMEFDEEKEGLEVIFGKVEDPRFDRTKKYPLNEVLFLSLCAIICGMDSWRGIEDYGNEKISFLQKYFPYKNGIPSFNTIGRVFSLIPSVSLESLFMEFMRWYCKPSKAEIIAIDGKTLRRSYDKGDGKIATHLLNVWSSSRGLCLGQIDVGEKTNEITAVPKVLEHLDIRGSIVTVDALNTQKEIAEKIIEHGGDYLMPIKGNHSKKEETIKNVFDREEVKLIPSYSHKQTVEKGHGRIEIRDYFCVKNVTYINDQENWRSLNTLCKVISTVDRGGEQKITEKYYITSHSPDIDVISDAIRGHWGIENGLHWVLDVIFGEDQSRKRKDHAPRNFSLLRKIALNIINTDKSPVGSLIGKKRRALMNKTFLETMLTGSGFLQSI